jgi:hypothetical protein
MSVQTLLTVRIDEIPHYLRSSAFANAIDGEDDAIEVPANCFKGDLNSKDDRDLSLVLSTPRFWIVDTIPCEVILNVIWKKPFEFLRAGSDFMQEFQYLSFLQALCDGSSRGQHGLAYWGYDSDLIWSTNPTEAAAQICLICCEHANGNIWTTETTTLSARCGQHRALRFLHQHGCSWDASTCTEVASEGHLVLTICA